MPLENKYKITKIKMNKNRHLKKKKKSITQMTKQQKNHFKQN